MLIDIICEVGTRQKAKQTFNYSKLKNEAVDKGEMVSNLHSSSNSEEPLIDFNGVPPMLPLEPIEIPAYSNVTSVLNEPLEVLQQQSTYICIGLAYPFGPFVTYV